MEILCHRQELDLKQGVLARVVRFHDPEGRRTTLTQRRIVSMAERHHAALETTWLPENWSGRMEVRSALDGRVTNNGVPRYRDLNGTHLEPVETQVIDDESIYLKVELSQSGLLVAQADVLMLFYLFSAEEIEELFNRLGYDFDHEMIPRNIDYYLKRTSNGSTLSGVVNSWVLARSNRARSWHLFTEALKSDIADVQGGTTPEGIHLGAMAGTVDLIQRCYTGIEARGDTLRINPQLPDELKRLCLRIRYREASLYLEVTHGFAKVNIVHCPVAPIRIQLGGRVMELKEGEEAKMDLPAH